MLTMVQTQGQVGGRLTVGATAKGSGYVQRRCAAAAAVHHQVGGIARNWGGRARGRVVGAHHIRAAVLGSRERPGEGAAGPEGDWRSNWDSGKLQGQAKMLPASIDGSALGTRGSLLAGWRFCSALLGALPAASAAHPWRAKMYDHTAQQGQPVDIAACSNA